MNYWEEIDCTLEELVKHIDEDIQNMRFTPQEYRDRLADVLVFMRCVNNDCECSEIECKLYDGLYDGYGDDDEDCDDINMISPEEQAARLAEAEAVIEESRKGEVKE